MYFAINRKMGRGGGWGFSILSPVGGREGRSLLSEYDVIGKTPSLLLLSCLVRCSVYIAYLIGPVGNHEGAGGEDPSPATVRPRGGAAPGPGQAEGAAARGPGPADGDRSAPLAPRRCVILHAMPCHFIWSTILLLQPYRVVSFRGV